MSVYELTSPHILDFSRAQREALVGPSKDDDYWNGVMVETQMMFETLMREKNEGLSAETKPVFLQKIGEYAHEGILALSEIFAHTAYAGVIAVGCLAIYADILNDAPAPQSPIVELTTLTR